MRVIHIDAQNKEVKEEQIDSTKVLQELQRLVGTDIITGTAWGMRQEGKKKRIDTLIVDDEGYFKDNNKGFVLEGDFYVGNGVINGVNTVNGDTVPAGVSVELIKDQIRFMTIQEFKKMYLL
jgi:hypothetical protein